MLIVFVVASSCMYVTAYIPTMNGERKMREKDNVLTEDGCEDEDMEHERNLHTTPSFYRHLSAIFMFCWADFFLGDDRVSFVPYRRRA